MKKNFRFFDNRQKYLLFVTTTNEKNKIADNLKDEVKESSLHNKEGKKVGEILSREGKYGFIFFKNKDDQTESVYLDGQILNIL